MPDIQTTFLCPFPMPPLGEGEHYSRDQFSLQFGARSLPTPSRQPLFETSYKNRSKVGPAGSGQNRSKLGQKYMFSCIVDLFCPEPPRPTFDLFLTYFNCLGVSGPLARPPFHNPCVFLSQFSVFCLRVVVLFL